MAIVVEMPRDSKDCCGLQVKIYKCYGNVLEYHKIASEFSEHREFIAWFSPRWCYCMLERFILEGSSRLCAFSLDTYTASLGLHAGSLGSYAGGFTLFICCFTM